MSDQIIQNRDQLRSVYKPAMGGALKKVLPHLDKHCVEFIARSPFFVLSTSAADGSLDASPKGGEPGFLHVEDAGTLMMPDWPGNNRLDSLENILDNPHVGLMLLVPGVHETLRINGSAKISVDKDLRTRLAIDGKLPLSVLIISVQEAYLHCARALWRSDLWNADKHIDRASLPTMGQMLADQIEGYNAAETDKLIAANRHKLYGLD